MRARLQQEQAAKSWAKWSWASGFEGFNAAGAGAAAGAGPYARGPSRSGSRGSNGGGADSSGEWGGGGSGYDSEFEDGTLGGRERQRIAKLAAKAARASRQYKAWQEMNASRNRVLLVASTSASDAE